MKEIVNDLNTIQKNICDKKAKVLTATDFKNYLREDKLEEIENVDVVTCGTMGVMSGTMAILSIPVAEPGTFKRAESITLNGVPATVGPCPNESLGLVDCILYGTSRRDMNYGGGHLFRDMVSGKDIDVNVKSEGKEYSNKVKLENIPFARIILTRGAFMNYTAFTNGSEEPFTTIFSGPKPLEGNYSEASVSGCGSINPLQNDPKMRHIRPGAAVLLNGAKGMIIGTGTRSTPSKPNLSVAADMHEMNPRYMGGFRTSEGPECVTSVAVAIPVVDYSTYEDLVLQNSDIPLPVADVKDRVPLYWRSYDTVWEKDKIISANYKKCINCGECTADKYCPMDAHPSEGIDESLCLSCGICVNNCKGKVFSADLGSISFEGFNIPVTVRQSSRFKAEELCELLKKKIEDGDWFLRCYDGRL